MSASLNKVFLMGNLTRDPEINKTSQGTSVCHLGLAVNRVFKGTNGAQQKEVSFFNVTVWGTSGENCARYLAKGRPVLVEGRLQTRQYEANGEKRTSTDIVADNVQFLGGAMAGIAAAESLQPGDFQSPELPVGADGEVPF